MNNELAAENIFKEITTYVNDDVSFIDALVCYSEIHNIEIEVLGSIVRKSQIMKAKVYEDAETLNLIEKVQRLPI